MTSPDAIIDVLAQTYRDVALIDQRRTGSRYSATRSDGVPISVDVIPPELVARMAAPEAFAPALRGCDAVTHPALPLPVGGGFDGGILYCAYARGSEQPIIAGSQSPDMISAIGRRLAEALGEAHGRGVAHGAITLDRILVDENGAARLSAFGLFPALLATGLTAGQVSAGLCDPPYLSPERQRGGEPDDRSDVYGLGASLYEMLTGKPPFGGRTTSFVMASVLADHELTGASASSGRLVEALLRAIEHAPSDRWLSARAFAAALGTGGDAAAQTVEAQSNGVWGKLHAIFQRVWFPARRSRE